MRVAFAALWRRLSACAAAQVHKVGGTTLRHVLLRAAAARNATVGVLGCTAQREPLQAHLSASHVVCPGRTRCATRHARRCTHHSFGVAHSAVL